MEGVSKTFPPSKQVLKNIWLSFFYGAKIGVLGLNGSGKSTLLKIIAGVEPNYEGKISFDGNTRSVTWNRNRSWTNPKPSGRSWRKAYRRSST
jgi:ATPase subunit of ABC transporter with duplicated ATPase domains